jgi:hypothetical protein
MNGTFLTELGKYLEARLGPGAWERVLTWNGVGSAFSPSHPA